jgi:tetratricopeptide (TPR) repeat protein
LNPFPPSWYFVVLGAAYRVLRRFVEGIASFKKAISIEPTNLITRVALLTAYSLDGSEIEAHSEAEEILRIDPKFSVERYAKNLTFMNQEYRDFALPLCESQG